MIYFAVGQSGLPGHSGGGEPQHTATRKGCFDSLWAAPVLATAPSISILTAMALRVLFGIAFLYLFMPGQPGLPGHAGGGNPQHTATFKDCFDLLWAAPVLATAPIISMLTATIFRILVGIAFLLIGRKVSTFALPIH